MCGQAVNDHSRPNKGCVTENCVPFVIPGLTSSSSTASSSTSRVSDSSSSSSNTGRSHKKASENWSDTQEKPKNKKRMTIEMQMNVCEIFRSAWRSSQIIKRTQRCHRLHTFLSTQIRNSVRSWYQTRAQYFYSLSERPKLRSTLENQNDKAFLQTTQQ